MPMLKQEYPKCYNFYMLNSNSRLVRFWFKLKACLKCLNISLFKRKNFYYFQESCHDILICWCFCYICMTNLMFKGVHSLWYLYLDTIFSLPYASRHYKCISLNLVQIFINLECMGSKFVSLYTNENNTEQHRG